MLRRIVRRGWYAYREFSLEDGLALWADYVEMSMETTATLPPERVFTLSYETFLENPVATLADLAAFAGLQVEPQPRFIPQQSLGQLPQQARARHGICEAVRKLAAICGAGPSGWL